MRGKRQYLARILASESARSVVTFQAQGENRRAPE